MYTEGPKIGYTLLSININVYILYYIFFLNATEKKPIDTQAVCSLLLSYWNVLLGPLWYSSNIVESGIKHHNPNSPFWFMKLTTSVAQNCVFVSDSI